jgi:chaperonin cofactor prefoldin
MVTTVITLLTLCVGLVFVFMASLKNISKDIEKLKNHYKNEINTINHRFDNVYDHEGKYNVKIFKLEEKNTLLDKRILKLEKEILQLKSGDNSKFY